MTMSEEVKMCEQCNGPLSFNVEWDELLKIARQNSKELIRANKGIDQVLVSNNNIAKIIDELKPLKELPQISNNLTSIVERLIVPATTKSRDWPALILVGFLFLLICLVLLKEHPFRGLLKGYGAEASIENFSKENI